MHLLTDYFEKSIQVMLVVVVAEIFQRIFRIFHEYLVYSNYYESKAKFSTITKRSFGMNLKSRIGYTIYFFATTVFVTSRGSWPPANFFTFMPLYWMFMGLNMSNSHLHYTDWVRQPHGLDYAAGMAANYFHGYLKLILPTHAGDTGLKERMERYENQHKIKFAFKRLFILVPSKMFINSKIESKLLQKDGVMTVKSSVVMKLSYIELNIKMFKPLETIVKHRAGVERPFKNDVYRLNVPINGAYYYVALEGATPMLSFFDALNFLPSRTWQLQEMSREVLLKFYKHLKNLLNCWPETHGRAELILYNSYKSDGRPEDVGEVVLSYIKNMWNERE